MDEEMIVSEDQVLVESEADESTVGDLDETDADTYLLFTKPVFEEKASIGKTTHSNRVLYVPSGRRATIIAFLSARVGTVANSLDNLSLKLTVLLLLGSVGPMFCRGPGHFSRVPLS